MRKAAVAVAAGAMSVSATSYTWTGEGTGDAWDTLHNWGLTATSYPDDSADDATFPDDGGAWGEVELITVTIDDLTVRENVDFVPKSGSPTLTTDRLVIQPVTDGGEVVITPSGVSIIVN